MNFTPPPLAQGMTQEYFNRSDLARRVGFRMTREEHFIDFL
jgi:hypothetical protein